MAAAKRSAQASLSAYVLHRYDWSETSLILDLFTRDLGRVAVAAKGAKRPYSQMRAVLLPFQRINVTLGRPRTDGAESDIQTLRGAEWAGGAAMLTGSALFSGFYLNELLMKLLARHDPHPALFDAYADTLPALALPGDAAVQAALRGFELNLLREVGVLPDLSLVTLTQQLLRAPQSYALLPEIGVSAVSEPAPAGGGPSSGPGLTGEVLLAIHSALVAGDGPALRSACGRALPELKAALRGLLHYHLGTDQLRTRRVMQTLPSSLRAPS
jgi:DNA repair protein RecO (recombination protein O)